MKCINKKFEYDVFVIHTSPNGTITNMKSLRKWLRNDLYSRYHMFTNSEGIAGFMVFDYKSNSIGFETPEDGDVLMFPLDIDGKRVEEQYPTYCSYVDFNRFFE